MEPVEELKENITLRFNKQVLDKLRYEADQRNVSVNSIIQEVISDHYSWNAKASKAGMIPLHKSMLAMLLDKVSDEQVIEISELFARTKIKDILLVLRSNYNLTSFLDMLESWLKDGSVMFGKDLKNDRYSYVVHHDLGNKWSLFLSTLIKTVLNDLNQKSPPEIQVTENTLMFDIALESLDAKV